MFTTVDGLGLAPQLTSTRRSLPAWLASLPRGAVSPFASLTAAALAALPKPTGAVEPRTKTAFPGEYCHLVKKACPRLTGVGCVWENGSCFLWGGGWRHAAHAATPVGSPVDVN